MSSALQALAASFAGPVFDGLWKILMDFVTARGIKLYMPELLFGRFIYIVKQLCKRGESDSDTLAQVHLR